MGWEDAGSAGVRGQASAPGVIGRVICRCAGCEPEGGCQWERLGQAARWLGLAQEWLG